MIVRRIAALAVTGLALASCSSTEAGTATPAPAASDGGQNVPSVSEPLDVTPFLADPCSLVQGDEPDRVGYENPDPSLPETDSGARLSGPSCTWSAKAKGGGLRLGLPTENAKRGTGGLQGIYMGYETKQFSYLEPTEVDGYPAVFADGADLRKGGTTALRVGIADDMIFTVNIGPLGDGKQQEAEDGARVIAEAVIETLKAGQ